MSLQTIAPGLFSLLVDAGRPRTRSLGVPLGGAADRESWQLGNALLGNDPHAVALEITLAGPTLRAEVDVGMVVFGAPFELRTDRATQRAGVPFTLQAGETLRIGGTPIGARAYLCVCGGFVGQSILGSQSAFQPLSIGQRLECSASIAPTHHLGHWANPDRPDPSAMETLHYLPGNQADWFPERILDGETFAVTPASNRMGVRLSGPALVRRAGEMVSEPVMPGTVQVTNDGQCIILGVDGQTIGGYPKVAQIIGADWDRLSQLRPGARVRFQPVSLAQAESRWQEQSARRNEWLIRLSVAELHRS